MYLVEVHRCTYVALGSVQFDDANSRMASFMLPKGTREGDQGPSNSLDRDGCILGHL
jgi:hypothetical protein